MTTTPKPLTLTHGDRFVLPNGKEVAVDILLTVQNYGQHQHYYFGNGMSGAAILDEDDSPTGWTMDDLKPVTGEVAPA